MVNAYGLACPLTKQLMRDPVVAGDGWAQPLASTLRSGPAHKAVMLAQATGCMCAAQAVACHLVTQPRACCHLAECSPAHSDAVRVTCSGERHSLTTPVCGRYTYERSAIEAWLSQHGVSPITKLPLPGQSELVPNLTMRSAIHLLIPQH